MIASRHPHDVPRIVIQAIIVFMMPVRSGLIGVDPVLDVPFVCELMRGIDMPIQRLIDGLVAAHMLSVQRHQRVFRPEIRRANDAPISTNEFVVRGAANRFAIIQSDFQELIGADVPRGVEQCHDDSAEGADRIAPEHFLATLMPLGHLLQRRTRRIDEGNARVSRETPRIGRLSYANREDVTRNSEVFH